MQSSSGKPDRTCFRAYAPFAGAHNKPGFTTRFQPAIDLGTEASLKFGNDIYVVHYYQETKGILPNPPRSLKGTFLVLTQRMTALVEKWTAIRDRRAIFPACYQRMTENMLTALANDEFHDPDWVLLLTNDFANYYFAALQSWEQNTGGPLVWQYTFACALHQNMSVAQHLLLGVNAHINCDLVIRRLVATRVACTFANATGSASS